MVQVNHWSAAGDLKKAQPLAGRRKGEKVERVGVARERKKERKPGPDSSIWAHWLGGWPWEEVDPRA